MSPAPADLSAFAPAENFSNAESLPPHAQTDETLKTLSSLPVGARLILRCRKDWRDACIMSINADCIVLSVGSPTGRTYRVRRPHDSPLIFDGLLPLLGEGSWRVGFARYDARW
jgi:hypothetical protein